MSVFLFLLVLTITSSAQTPPYDCKPYLGTKPSYCTKAYVQEWER